MKIADTGADYVSAPKDYAELFQLYYPYVVNLVRRWGIEESRKEDVASEILLRFYERNFLEKFDPCLVFTYNGQTRPARFKSFLSKVVLAYVRGHYDKQQRLTGRELLIADATVRGEDGTDGATWLEVYGGNSDAAEASIMAVVSEQVAVDRMRTYLAGIPRRSAFDTCDLVALFDQVVRQVRETGELNVSELWAHFGTSATAMHSWLWWLRGNLTAARGHQAAIKRALQTPVDPQ